MRTIKEILEAFKKDLRISFQAQKNVVDISERYIHELSEADLGGKGGVDYSLDEQDTGLKWLDGKNIYCKTFTNVNIPMNRYDVAVDLGVLASHVIKIDFLYEAVSSGTSIVINCCYTRVQSGNTTILNPTSNVGAFTAAAMCVYYTK